MKMKSMIGSVFAPDVPESNPWRRLHEGRHDEPHAFLGAHPAQREGRSGVVVRAFHHDATRAACLRFDGERIKLQPVVKGGFEGFVPDATLPLDYRLEFAFPDGAMYERDDPYRFEPTIGDLDLHLINEGTHRRLWEVLGAHARRVRGVEGVAFTVWAPNAARVSVIGEFCRWDGRMFPMRRMGMSGVYELFVPGLTSGALYKYEIYTRDGHLRIKADPCGFAMEMPPRTASRVYVSTHGWEDEEWMRQRPNRNLQREPISIYEVHLGSWKQKDPSAGNDDPWNKFLNYRDIAPALVEHAKRFGFTHIELMPVSEHAFGPSWGYQVTGYYAPTARYGEPDDFRYFVDYCHRHGVGVILDWVPAHFPKDDFALRRFDGTALYEHEDARKGEHPDWGTLIFNYGRHEVRNFLIANALYWLREFHVDGLRVDAVASMLYLDYSRREGEWIANPHGGKENLEAIEFLQTFNRVVSEECPGCFTVAEESTGWTGVSHPIAQHGLGFAFKWNMGWMHDTLGYFSCDPLYRKYHHNELTFSMLYEYTERFLNPLSHDEVVHGKGSLLGKMPGDAWQKFANLRALLTYQYTRPGKQLVFMGTEYAPDGEWRHDREMDRLPKNDLLRERFARFMEDLGRLYNELPCLWRGDPDGHGFRWVDCHDNEQSILSYLRQHDRDYLFVVMNLTPVPRDRYRLGSYPVAGYRYLFNSDDPAYGGGGYPLIESPQVEPQPWHGFEKSVVLNLPPLAVMVLAPVR